MSFITKKLFLFTITMYCMLSFVKSQPTTSNDLWNFPLAVYDEKMPASLTSAGSLLYSITFGYLNIKSLSEQYKKGLVTELEIINTQIKPQTGVLLKFEYNADDNSGTADVSPGSVKFLPFQSGRTAEESFAKDELPTIGIAYEGQANYPDIHKSYVWVFKEADNRLSISSINDPFVDAFEARGNNLKINNLSNSEISGAYPDGIIQQFDNIQRWKKHIDNVLQNNIDLEKKQRINSLNEKYVKSQNEFSALYNSYQKALAEREALNSFTFLINSCDLVLNTYAQAKSNEQSEALQNEKNANKIMLDGMTKQLKALEPKVENSRSNLFQDDKQFRDYLRQKKLPTPPQIEIPSIIRIN